jgi:hypothetical protein
MALNRASVPCRQPAAMQQPDDALLTRYRLSNSMSLGFGSEVSTGTSTPSTHSCSASTQSTMILGYLRTAASPRCVQAGRAFLPRRCGVSPLLQCKPRKASVLTARSTIGRMLGPPCRAVVNR